MRLLKYFGYKGLSIRELKPYLTGEKLGKVVGITFDDGYQNNLINAAPILKKYNFTATSYLVSKYIGLTNIWDKPKGITQRPLMSDDEIKTWLSFGMDIGAHTLSHVDLTSASVSEAIHEVEGCKIGLEKKFNIPIEDFCYPFGKFNEKIYKIAKNAGYLSALTMVRGRVNSNSNILKLPRIPVTHHTFPHLFLIKLFTNYEDKRSN